MLDWTSTALADCVWVLALVVMTLCSARAWLRMDAEAWAPLQWNRDGRPMMRAQRDLAVAFTPMVAMAGGLLLAAGARLGDPSQTGWVALRLVTPLLLAITHQMHLTSALKTLKAEGSLRR
ncbi:MAG TPA: hypothetical protein VGM25_08620 [Caulobacteraceae bacterium]